jgi:hypothetical protein
MAPARMIQFIKNHVATCEVCLTDTDINDEIEKITELILPESKIPKAVRLQLEQDDLDIEVDDDEIEVDDDDDDVETVKDDEEEEEDEYMDDDDDIEADDLNELG